uniref:Uncharacterized protein n=1 Tax=Cyclopterus lumpus TaxID=8103 RepID=A0A8C2WR56_CYCLU
RKKICLCFIMGADGQMCGLARSLRVLLTNVENFTLDTERQLHIQSNKDWQDKYEALEDNTNTLLLERIELKEDIHSLNDKLDSQSQLPSQSNKDWQNKYEALEGNTNTLLLERIELKEDVYCLIVELDSKSQVQRRLPGSGSQF